MKLSLTIMAHGAAEDIFHRHVRYWNAVDATCRLVITPFDNPLIACPWGQQKVGNREHSGREAHKRLTWLVQYLLSLYFCDYHLICEYDSFPLQPMFNLVNGLVGNLQPNHEPARFMAPHYANPPWLIDHHSLVQMAEVMRKHRDVYEEGFADRYLSALAHLAGVPILPHDPPGFTKATIELSDIDQMQAAIRAGGVMLHGVKTQTVLDAAKEATALII